MISVLKNDFERLAVFLDPCVGFLINRSALIRVQPVIQCLQILLQQRLRLFPALLGCDGKWK